MNVETEIHFLIEPIFLVYSVSRRIIKGKLINSRKDDQNSPSKAKNLSWKYQGSKDSRNLIYSIHRKYKERINFLVSSLETQITIKG